MTENEVRAKKQIIIDRLRTHGFTEDEIIHEPCLEMLVNTYIQHKSPNLEEIIFFILRNQIVCNRHLRVLLQNKVPLTQQIIIDGQQFDKLTLRSKDG